MFRGGEKPGQPGQHAPTAQPAPGRYGARGQILLQPTKNPGGTAFVFGNITAVSQRDFNYQGDFLLEVIVEGRSHVVTSRAIPEVRPGEIGLTEFQRAWMGVGMGPRDVVEVLPFTAPLGTQEPDAVPYAGQIEVDIGWARPNQTTEDPFPEKELGDRFLYIHENQVLHVDQPVIVNFKGMPNVVIKVVGLKAMDFGTDRPASIRRALVSRAAELIVRQSVPRLQGAKGPAQTNAILKARFSFEEVGIGGLDEEFKVIFRRAFASRLLDPIVAKRMGLQHCRGLLLFGPPGTGKTLIARQLSKTLNTRPPKIINGPEILNKYVGQSEENVRKIFEDAEKEYKEKGDLSGLHIIIFDELDAVCKQRGSGAGGGTGVGDTIVNQLLTKMDGVDQLNNILLIGMTNRKDMIDEALLRPGRMEIHVEISLPDEAGRVQIFRIHTTNLRESKHLAPDVKIDDLAKETKNYSGAEIAGLVRSAASFAISRSLGGDASAQITTNPDDIMVTGVDFEDALAETTPMFGVSKDTFGNPHSYHIIDFSDHIKNILATGKQRVGGLSDQSTLVSMLLWGPNGSGKTALAIRIALDSEAPFIQKVNADDFLGLTDLQKISAIDKIFRDADRSEFSVIIVDELETLIDYTGIGPRFSISMMTAFRAILTRVPPKQRKRLIIATTSERLALTQLGLNRFSTEVAVPNLDSWEDFWSFLKKTEGLDPNLAKAIFKAMRERYGDSVSVGVKFVREAIIIASNVEPPIAVDVFMNQLEPRMVLAENSSSLQQFAFAT